MLKIENLQVAVGDKPILKGLDLTVPAASQGDPAQLCRPVLGGHEESGQRAAAHDRRPGHGDHGLFRAAQAEPGEHPRAQPAVPVVQQNADREGAAARVGAGKKLAEARLAGLPEDEHLDRVTDVAERFPDSRAAPEALLRAGDAYRELKIAPALRVSEGKRGEVRVESQGHELAVGVKVKGFDPQDCELVGRRSHSERRTRTESRERSERE